MAKPLLAIVGPTASGKTALSLRVATLLPGEILCADSRTVYCGMDIGTAKPTAAEQEVVPHHGLDVVDPDEEFSVAAFQQLAKREREGIWARHRVPVVVGGSGLYIDALCYDFALRQPGPVVLEQSLEELQGRVEELGITMNHSDFHNARRLQRAIATGGATAGKRAQLPEGWHIIGLDPGMETLEVQMAERTEAWIDDGLVEETQWLLERYGEVEPLNTSPYREVQQLLNREIDEAEAARLINQHLRQLAKRQLTWFHRNPDIHWFPNPDAAYEYVQALNLKPV